MTRCGIGVIGAGSIGRRMLRHARAHARVAPVAVWDPDAAKLRRAAADAPGIVQAASAAAVIGHAAVDVVYVASPPASHAGHVHAALDAAKPVLCEKPLGVDEGASRELVAHAARAGVPAAVNFIHASGAGPRLAAALAAGALGAVRCAELRIHARQWAARRYAEAPWLRLQDQGGLVREVISHFVFLSHRLFGAARVVYCRRGGAAAGRAETQVQAHLVCGGVPVFVFGNTEGEGPDVVEYTVWGESSSRRLCDLYRLFELRDGAFVPADAAPADAAADWFRAQLDNVADWAGGRRHTLPDFAEAFAVQQVIERMVRS